jgi:hypothetical protein
MSEKIVLTNRSAELHWLGESSSLKTYQSPAANQTTTVQLDGNAHSTVDTKPQKTPQFDHRRNIMFWKNVKHNDFWYKSTNVTFSGCNRIDRSRIQQAVIKYQPAGRGIRQRLLGNCVETGTGHEAWILESVMAAAAVATTNISYTVCRYIHNLKPKIHVPRYK